MDKKKADELEIKFNPEDYKLEDVAATLAKFLGDECKKQTATLPSMNIGFLVGGYLRANHMENRGWWRFKKDYLRPRTITRT